MCVYMFGTSSTQEVLSMQQVSSGHKWRLLRQEGGWVRISFPSGPSEKLCPSDTHCTFLLSPSAPLYPGPNFSSDPRPWILVPQTSHTDEAENFFLFRWTHLGSPRRNQEQAEH